jgi:hypothetical protein
MATQPPISDDTFDIRESYPAQEQVAAAAGWDDPAMDDYNDYDAHRKAQMTAIRDR